jgi:hypothetical protein
MLRTSILQTKPSTPANLRKWIVREPEARAEVRDSIPTYLHHDMHDNSDWHQQFSSLGDCISFIDRSCMLKLNGLSSPVGALGVHK